MEWITEPEWIPKPVPMRGWPIPVQHYPEPRPPLGTLRPLYFIEERADEQ